MIRFSIKLLLFLFVVFVIISFFVAKPSSNNSSSQTNSEATTGEVVMAFRQALNDLRKFCDRNIEACKVGKSFLSSLGERAHDGARAAYEYFGRILDEKKMEAPLNTTPKIGTEESTQKHKALP
ncbi:DUF5330 domain-containing protein [Bartonella florencae]|uniref:DUF5330 domain-containing protein n=1 Tax=Bartonella florencae TaxID=928210 RepID=UPI0002EB5586|nr:DUF5330 domain-containing protein [Bartonella florencae]